MNLTQTQTTENQDWNDGYLLNIDSIDKQHIKFFKLYDVIMSMSKSEENSFRLKEVLDELQEYTNYHFLTEETLMQNANSPGYDLHVIQHDFFRNKINEFLMAYNYQNKVLLDQIVIFMRKWLLSHISNMDREYVDSVQQYILKNAQVNKNDRYE